MGGGGGGLGMVWPRGGGSRCISIYQEFGCFILEQTRLLNEL